MNEPRKESWHLSKSVPITLILAIIGQTAAMAWLVSAMFSDIESNAKQITKNEVKIESISRTANEQAVQLGRIEQSLRDMHSTLERLARSLERSNHQ